MLFPVTDFINLDWRYTFFSRKTLSQKFANPYKSALQYFHCVYGVPILSFDLLDLTCINLIVGMVLLRLNVACYVIFRLHLL